MLQGIKLSCTPGAWPVSLPGFGAFHGGQPLARCARCRPDAPPAAYTTFVRYGDNPLCMRHVLELAI